MARGRKDAPYSPATVSLDAADSGAHRRQSEPEWLKKDWTGPPEGVFGPSVENRQSGESFGVGHSGFEVGFEEGKKIGQYELIRMLGRGGMGVVYLARDNKLGRRVAIKFLQIQHPELVRRFIVEARVTARCTHENIVVIHEVGEFAGSPFMVLEYVDGQPMASMRAQAPLPVTRAVEILVPVVRALARAHEEGIVHRDLKPENILLGNSGTVKVLDFGIAKLLEPGPSPSAGPPSGHRTMGFVSPGDSSQKTGLVGTMAYMSPEQWGMLSDIDHRTDIWAVGLILYEMLSGSHPLADKGDNPSHWVTQLHLPMPSLASAAPQVPAELVRVVDTCLRKSRDDRYATALDLLRALEPFLPGRYRAGQAQVETGPYTGLRAFQEEDASRFFGRSSELAEILARIRDTALLAVVGPSGVGKSSFLRAGVVPALKSSERDWEVLVVRPGRHPMLALAGAILPLLRDPKSFDGRGGVESSVRSRLITEAGFFGAVLRDFCRRTGKGVFLLVDQFEELYTLGTHVLERKAFTAALTGAADDPTSPTRVVATIRADFLGRIAEDANFMNELRSGLFFLGPPSAEGLREALVQPAEGTGYRFETDSMVNEMVHFLESSPNGLPLLQFTASQLWEHRDPVRHLLTEQSYRGLGGVSGALVTHADRVISLLSPVRQALCRNVFVHLVTPERTRAVRNVTELAELVGEEEELRPLIDELVDSRLLVVQTLSDGAAVEIVHESLILTWPTLRRWLDASHEDSLFLDQLLSASRNWDTNHRASGLLWSGEMVDELKRFQRRYQGNLPAVAEAFVQAISRQAARRKRFGRVLVVGGFSATVMLALGASAAAISINSARAKAVQSEAMAKENERKADANARIADEQRKQAQAALVAQIEAERRKETAEVKVQEQGRQLSRNEVELTRLLGLAQANATDAKANAKVANEQRDAAKRAQAEAQLERNKAIDAKKAAEEALTRFAARYGIPEDALKQN